MLRLGRDVLAQKAAIGGEAAGREYQRRAPRRLEQGAPRDDAGAVARTAPAHSVARPEPPRGSHESVGQSPRLEPHAGGQRISGFPLGQGGAEPLEPSQVGVETLEERALEPLLATRALGPEASEVAMAPNHAARQAHRAARMLELLEHEHFGPE